MAPESTEPVNDLRDRNYRPMRIHVRLTLSALWLIASACIMACAQGTPPTPDGSPSAAMPETLIPPVADPSPPEDASGEEAAIAKLPQTRDIPHAAGPAFDELARDLWEAIVSDTPERAMPFFFPLDAYVQVKDIERPDVDWKRRLVAAYVRDIHALHRRLERQAGDPARAKFIGLEVPEDRSRWVNPGEEYNKVGYFRVFGSRLRYSVDEATLAFDVKSLISWRGTWYVVHFRAIE